MSAWRAPLLGALLLAAAAPAIGDDVRVSGRFLRPMWRLQAGARDRDMQSTLSWVPATHQLVRVYQPRKLGDLVVGKIYCGSVWTDTNGRFDEDLVCGDGNLPDHLYLEVWAHSARGFSVGAFDRVKFDVEMVAVGGAAALAALFATVGTFGAGTVAAVATATGVGSDAILNLLDRAPGTYVWVSPLRRVNGSRAAFPTYQLGRGRTGSAADTGDYAAAVMEGVDFAYSELVRPAGNAPGPPPWVWSYWVLNNPYFGAPTTIWDKVHINPAVTNDATKTYTQNLDASWAHNIGALVHELGHVAYNIGHSDKNHYLDPNEALYYARTHYNCQTRVSAKYAQYEGFAEAVSQIVWRDPVYDVASPANCPSQLGPRYPPYMGFETEGNVADFYASMVSGFDNLRGAATLHDYTQVKQGANDVFLSPLDALLAMPRAAGPSSHTLASMWSAYWRQHCDHPSADHVPLLCGSQRFRCWVARTSQLAGAGELPGGFQGLDCGPGAVSNVVVTTRTATATTSANDVRFDGADHAETYSVTIRRPPAGSVVAVRQPTDPWVTGISLPPCQPHSVEVSAVNTFGTTSATAVTFTSGTHAVCGPGGPSVQSVTHSYDEADLFEARLEAMEVLRPADEEENQAPGTGRDPEPDKPRPATAGSTAAAPTPIEAQLNQVLSSGRRCYRVDLGAAPRADRYAVRYRLDNGVNDGEPSETVASPERELLVCLDGGRKYILNGVGYNDFGETPGPDYKYSVPHRLLAAQANGRVITHLPR